MFLPQRKFTVIHLFTLHFFQGDIHNINHMWNLDNYYKDKIMELDRYED